MGYLENLPDEYADSTTKTYPVIIFLHGMGERGNGTTDLYKVARHGMPKFIEQGQKIEVVRFDTIKINDCSTSVKRIVTKFICLSPQLGSTDGNWYESKVRSMINHALNTYRIDTNRIYLTGLSLGGNGTWNYIYSNSNKIKSVTAGVSAAGWGSTTKGCVVSARGIPVWAHHGDLDNIIKLSREKSMVDAVNNCTIPTPATNKKAFLTIYNGYSHDSNVWDRTYSPTNLYHAPNIYEWFLKYSK